ncbi:MAG TPA: hypothetical protein VFV72_16420 [Candidatus Limnocylindrales bacterium]|nr:hypothetical protein [Candidatus Limnocylindrales bacterium]
MTREGITAPRTRNAVARRSVAAMLAVVALSLGTVGGAAAKGLTVDPSDPRLTPNPIENSDEGTAWTCRLAGTDVACAGRLKLTWGIQEGPGDTCAVPLFSIDGLFSREQTRYYALDPASGLYLEVKRLIHLDAEEYLTPDPDPTSTNVVYGRLSMTWVSTFQTPGDLDSRSTRKQGIDTFIKPPTGGAFILDVGQKTEDLTIAPGEDFNFRGRWDIALGDHDVEFGKICAALGL